MDDTDDFDLDVFEDCEEIEESDSVGESSTSGSTSASSEPTSVLGKRIRYKYYVRLPRVLKRDIRRQYPLMIGNVMNSGDSNLCQSFCESFASSELNFRLKGTDTLGITTADRFNHTFSEVPHESQYNGYRSILFYWHVLTTLNMDYIARVGNSKVIARADTQRSRVEMDIDLVFTRVYDIHIVRFLVSIMASTYLLQSPHLFTAAAQQTRLQHQTQQQSAQGSDQARQLQQESRETHFDALSSLQSIMTAADVLSSTTQSSSSALTQVPDPFAFYYLWTGSRMPRLDNPEELCLKMKLTLHLNDDKQVDVFEVSNLSLFQVPR